MASRVSIVIPCYNQAHFLGDALRSAFAQVEAAAQVIVVDDGSPDRADIAAELARWGDRVTMITQDNAGLSAARNAGLAVCSSDYVIFLDADDRLLPDATRIGADVLDADPLAALAWGLKANIDLAGRRLAMSSPPAVPSPGYLDLLRGNLIGPPVTAIFRRSMLKAVSGFDAAIDRGEDFDIYLRLARQHPIRFHGATIAEYRAPASVGSSTGKP
jgi:glycosyltransferase involved in cell wall biosynthesis